MRRSSYDRKHGGCAHLVTVDEGHMAVLAAERVQAPLVQLQLRVRVLIPRPCIRGSPQLVSEPHIPAMGVSAPLKGLRMHFMRIMGRP